MTDGIEWNIRRVFERMAAEEGIGIDFADFRVKETAGDGYASFTLKCRGVIMPKPKPKGASP